MNELINSEFFLSHTGDLTITGLLINVFFSAFFCAILAWFYQRYGTTLTNRTTLAKTFILIGVTTTLVISIVKSSLALSLGLVGALSIVRFRAAIKEPEELAFIFLAIGIGLGFGADQRVVTAVAAPFIMALYLGQKTFMNKKTIYSDSLFLSVSLPNGTSDEIDLIVDLVARHIADSKIKRLDQTTDRAECIFVLRTDQYSDLSLLKNDLKDLFPKAEYSIIEGSGLN